MYIIVVNYNVASCVTFLCNYNNQVCNIHNERQISELCGSALALKGTCFLWPEEQEAVCVGKIMEVNRHSREVFSTCFFGGISLEVKFTSCE